MARSSVFSGKRKLLPFRAGRRGVGPSPPQRLPVLERIVRRFARGAATRLSAYTGTPCVVEVVSVSHRPSGFHEQPGCQHDAESAGHQQDVAVRSGRVLWHMAAVVPLDDVVCLAVDEGWVDTVARHALGAGGMPKGCASWPPSQVVMAVCGHFMHAVQLDLEAAFLPFFEIETVAEGELASATSFGEGGGWQAVLRLLCGAEEACWHLWFPDGLLAPLYPLFEDESLHVVPIEAECPAQMVDALLTLPDEHLVARIDRAHPQLGAVLLAACPVRRRTRLLPLLAPEMAEEVRRRMARRSGPLRVFTATERFVVRTLSLGESHTVQTLGVMTPGAAAAFVRALAGLEPLFAEQVEAVLRQDGAMVTAVEALVTGGEAEARRLLMRAFSPERVREVVALVEQAGGMAGGPHTPFTGFGGVPPLALGRVLSSAGLAVTFAVCTALVRRDPRHVAAVLGALPPEAGGMVLAALGRPSVGGGQDAMLVAETVLTDMLGASLPLPVTPDLAADGSHEMEGGPASVMAALLRHGVAPLREAALRACRRERAWGPETEVGRRPHKETSVPHAAVDGGDPAGAGVATTPDTGQDT